MRREEVDRRESQGETWRRKAGGKRERDMIKRCTEEIDSERREVELSKRQESRRERGANKERDMHWF